MGILYHHGKDQGSVHAIPSITLAWLVRDSPYITPSCLAWREQWQIPKPAHWSVTASV